MNISLKLIPAFVEWFKLSSNPRLLKTFNPFGEIEIPAPCEPSSLFFSKIIEL